MSRRPGISAGVDWDSQPLGDVADIRLAEVLGVDKSAVWQARTKRGIPPVAGVDWDSQPLGQVSDTVVAEATGCSVTTVKRHRDARGIPAYNRPVDCWDSLPLGEKPDTEVARAAGCSPVSVRYARNRRGIPTFERVVVCVLCGDRFKTKDPKGIYCSRRCHNRLSKFLHNNDLPVEFRGVAANLVNINLAPPEQNSGDVAPRCNKVARP